MTQSKFYEHDNKTFGGLIYQSDFDTEYQKTHNIASRIASDWKFDEWCRKNSLAKNRNKTVKEQ